MVLLVQCSDERVELCAFKGYPHRNLYTKLFVLQLV